MLSTNLDPVICTVAVDDNPLSTLLASVFPQIESQARKLAARVYSFNLETSDLCQEAMTGIWKNREKFTALSENHQTRLALRISLCSMIDYVRREFKQIPARSLDAWQEMDTNDGIMHREIAEQPRVCPITPRAERRRILAALRTLSSLDCMKFKTFSARTRRGLEEEVNKWLETHPVSPDTMRFQYSAVPHDDQTSEVTEYTLVLFYVPFIG